MPITIKTKYRAYYEIATTPSNLIKAVDRFYERQREIGVGYGREYSWLEIDGHDVSFPAIVSIFNDCDVDARLYKANALIAMVKASV